RDARQNCVENFSRKKETGSSSRSGATGNLSPPLYDGYFYPNALCRGSETRPHSGYIGLCEFDSYFRDFGWRDVLVCRPLTVHANLDSNLNCRNPNRFVTPF